MSHPGSFSLKKLGKPVTYKEIVINCTRSTTSDLLLDSKPVIDERGSDDSFLVLRQSVLAAARSFPSKQEPYDVHYRDTYPS